MKYQVAYHLMHSEYMPTTSMTLVDAYSHAELEARLAKIVAKWQARGYTIQIIRVTQTRGRKPSFYEGKRSMG